VGREVSSERDEWGKGWEARGMRLWGLGRGERGDGWKERDMGRQK
jgi:hypothetical protein